jgi:cytochrome c-type biogenesis protein CcmH
VGADAKTTVFEIAGGFLMRFAYGLALWLFSFALFASTQYPFADPKQEAQFTHLLKNLRCLVCQNQDLADSNASLAIDLRHKVYELVRDGQSDDEISDYLTARYGDFILFKPPVKTITALLWFGPFAFLIIGVVVFWRTCFRGVVRE